MSTNDHSNGTEWFPCEVGLVAGLAVGITGLTLSLIMI